MNAKAKQRMDFAALWKLQRRLAKKAEKNWHLIVDMEDWPKFCLWHYSLTGKIPRTTKTIRTPRTPKGKRK
jgi:hypothetical protein